MAQDSKSKVGLIVAGVLFLALLGQSAVIYPRLRVKDTEIARLREVDAAARRSAAENDASGKLAVQDQELARLRKENQELHRLRNEVRQLREATQQASKPAPAPAPAPAGLNAEVVAQLRRQVQQLQTENAQLRAAQQQQAANVQAQAQAQLQQASCLNNLRQLDGAKQQWALEHSQPAEAVPGLPDIEPYLRDAAVWNCPGGGVYTLNAVGLPPVCSLPGHVLP